MTIIINLEWRNNNKAVIIKKRIKDIYFKGRALELIDYTETNANKQFCDIQFKGDIKKYLISLNELNDKDNIKILKGEK